MLVSTLIHIPILTLSIKNQSQTPSKNPTLTTTTNTTGRIRSNLPHNQLQHNLAHPPNPPSPPSKHELRRRARRTNDKSKPTAREHRLLSPPRLRQGSCTRSRSRSRSFVHSIRKEMDNPHTSTGIRTRAHLPPRRSIAVDAALEHTYNNPTSRIRADRCVHVYFPRQFRFRVRVR